MATNVGEEGVEDTVPEAFLNQYFNFENLPVLHKDIEKTKAAINSVKQYIHPGSDENKLIVAFTAPAFAEEYWNKVNNFLTISSTKKNESNTFRNSKFFKQEDKISIGLRKYVHCKAAKVSKGSGKRKHAKLSQSNETRCKFSLTIAYEASNPHYKRVFWIFNKGTDKHTCVEKNPSNFSISKSSEQEIIDDLIAGLNAEQIRVKLYNKELYDSNHNYDSNINNYSPDLFITKSKINALSKRLFGNGKVGSDAVGVEAWVETYKQKEGWNIKFEPRTKPSDVFLLVIISPTGKALLEKFGSLIHIDATHCVCHYNIKFIPVTIVGRQGQPTAWIIASDEKTETIAKAFDFILNVTNIKVKFVMSDLAPSSYNGIVEASTACSNPKPKWLYCAFHLKQAWMKALTQSSELNKKQRGTLTALIMSLLPKLEKVKKGSSVPTWKRTRGEMPEKDLKDKITIIRKYMDSIKANTLKNFFNNNYFFEGARFPMSRWAMHARIKAAKEMAKVPAYQTLPNGNVSKDEKYQLFRLHHNLFSENIFRNMKMKYCQPGSRMDNLLKIIVKVDRDYFVKALKNNDISPQLNGGSAAPEAEPPLIEEVDEVTDDVLEEEFDHIEARTKRLVEDLNSSKRKLAGCLNILNDKLLDSVNISDAEVVTALVANLRACTTAIQHLQEKKIQSDKKLLPEKSKSIPETHVGARNFATSSYNKKLKAEKDAKQNDDQEDEQNAASSMPETIKEHAKKRKRIKTIPYDEAFENARKSIEKNSGNMMEVDKPQVNHQLHRLKFNLSSIRIRNLKYSISGTNNDYTFNSFLQHNTLEKIIVSGLKKNDLIVSICQRMEMVLNKNSASKELLQNECRYKISGFGMKLKHWDKKKYNKIICLIATDNTPTKSGNDPDLQCVKINIAKNEINFNATIKNSKFRSFFVQEPPS